MSPLHNSFLLLADTDVIDFVPLVAIICMFGVLPGLIFGGQIIKAVAIRFLDNRMKLKLLDRGLTPEEVERLMNAGTNINDVIGDKRKQERFASRFHR